MSKIAQVSVFAYYIPYLFWLTGGSNTIFAWLLIGFRHFHNSGAMC